MEKITVERISQNPESFFSTSLKEASQAKLNANISSKPTAATRILAASSMMVCRMPCCGTSCTHSCNEPLGLEVWRSKAFVFSRHDSPVPWMLSHQQVQQDVSSKPRLPWQQKMPQKVSSVPSLASSVVYPAVSHGLLETNPCATLAILLPRLFFCNSLQAQNSFDLLCLQMVTHAR